MDSKAGKDDLDVDTDTQPRSLCAGSMCEFFTHPPPSMAALGSRENESFKFSASYKMKFEFG